MTNTNETTAGNGAKMREALKAVRMFLDGYTVNNLELRRMVDAALAAPPRNCDRFDTGDVDKDADDAMRSMLEEMKSDGNFGFRGIASYLLSPCQKKGDEE